MSTVRFKEKLEKPLAVRFTKKQRRSIIVYCKKNKIQFSDLVRNTVMKEVGDES